MTYTNDTQLLFEAYKKGELDIVGVAPEWLQEINSTDALKADFIRFPAAIGNGLAFNNADKRFQDKNVSVAFSQAIDRNGWVNDVLKDIGIPYTRWIHPVWPG